MAKAPSTAAPPSRRGAALVALVVVAGGGYAAWRWLGRTTDERERVVDEGAADAGAALVARGTTALADVDPYAKPGAMAAEEIATGLKARLSVRRLAVLKEIVARGTLDREALAAVEAQTKDEDPVVALWAKAAVMRITGERRYVLEIARLAAEAPAFVDPAEILRVLDPRTSGALVRAIGAERALRERSARAPEGLEAAIERLARDPADGERALAEGVARGDALDLPTWLDVVVGCRPVPKAAIDAVLERWPRGAPAERDALQRFLAGPGVDLAAAGPMLPAFVAERLVGASDADAARWVGVVRRLATVEGPLADRLLERARASSIDAQNALAVFSALGEKARGVAARLVELARAQPEEARAPFAQGLATIGGEAIVAYAAERLARGSAAERAAWVDAIQAPSDPTPLVAPLVELTAAADEGLAARAAGALARVATASIPDAAASALGDLVADRRAPVRAATIAALDAAATWPAPLASALARATTDADPAARAAAVRAVSGVWRLGAAAKPLVPTLLRLVDDADAAAAVPDAKARALRSLAAIAPDDAGARTAFVAAAADAAAEVRRAAVYGLSRLPVPTPAEKAALAARGDDPALRALVAATLARPAWRAIK